ncbi:MAG: hypothetical protein JNL12_20315 [Planctomycetes bacterium]|nr:hypothetical protein [Planctomycetota bacterium]
MSLSATNVLNIALMVLSAGLAFALPFEVFLVSYAVLGPLHYLTQISWLHERQYFLPRRGDWLVLAGLTVLHAALSLAAHAQQSANLMSLGTDVLLWCFLWALIVASTTDQVLRVTGMLVCSFAVFFLHGQPATMILIGLLLPTVLHVFVFTGVFVLHGAARNRSLSGWLSFAVFLACGAATIWAEVGTLGYRPSAYATAAYDGALTGMHVNLMHTLGLADGVVPTGSPNHRLFPFGSHAELFENEASVRLGRFLAYIYTYHYLNWFSKTSVIRWHQVPRARLAMVVVLWAASVAIYAIDYQVGLSWLLLLSVGHVVLEFPLDWKTLVGLPRELSGRRGGATARSGAH